MRVHKLCYILNELNKCNSIIVEQLKKYLAFTEFYTLIQTWSFEINGLRYDDLLPNFSRVFTKHNQQMINYALLLTVETTATVAKLLLVRTLFTQFFVRWISIRAVVTMAFHRCFYVSVLTFWQSLCALCSPNVWMKALIQIYSKWDKSHRYISLVTKTMFAITEAFAFFRMCQKSSKNYCINNWDS